MLADLKEKIYRYTIIVENFNILLTSIDRSSRQKIKKKTMALNDTLGSIT